MTQADIIITELKLDTIIGIHDWEKQKKQPVIANIKIKININKAAKHDDIQYSLNYEDLTNTLRAWSQQSSHKLLESFAINIINKVKEFYPHCSQVSLKLEKRGVVAHTYSCGIELEQKFS